jgi:hypothetical protein
LIICYVHDYQIVCHWSDFEDDGTSWCTHAFDRIKGWNDFQNEVHHPTHWMPLPKPPTDKQFGNHVHNIKCPRHLWEPIQ